MLHKSRVAGCLMVLALCAPSVWAADDLLSSQMVDQARQWEQKGRTDLAAAVWRKLLQGSPKHPEALVKLGMIEVAEGNTAQADSLLKRASQLPSAPVGIGALSAAVAQSKGLTPVIETPNVKESAVRAVTPKPVSDFDIVIREKPAAASKTRSQKAAQPTQDLPLRSKASKKTKEIQITQSPASKSEKVASLLELARKEQQTDGASAKEQERVLLEKAMVLDPGNAPTRLALAGYYQRAGEWDTAGTLLDDLIESKPDMPAALQARASLYAAQQKWWEGLETLEKIPVSARSADTAKEQQRLWVNAQVQRALYLYQQGNTARSNSIMEQAQVGARQEGELVALVSQGWSDIGQPAKALRIMRDMIGSSPERNKDTQIKYARILLDNRQDVELTGLLRDLSVQAGLTQAQQNDINRIILGYTLRLTEALREAGKLSEATAMINPALQRFDDPRLLRTMAKIYQSAGNTDAALELVERLIAREPDELSHRLLACELALAGNALVRAQGHALAALGLAPEHPRALAMAGRVEKALGSTAKAFAYFQRSQASESTRDPLAKTSDVLSLRLIDNEPIQTGLPQVMSKTSAVERTGLLPLPEISPSPRGASSDMFINPNPPVGNAPGPARL